MNLRANVTGHRFINCNLVTETTKETNLNTFLKTFFFINEFNIITSINIGFFSFGIISD